MIATTTTTAASPTMNGVQLRSCAFVWAGEKSSAMHRFYSAGSWQGAFSRSWFVLYFALKSQGGSHDQESSQAAVGRRVVLRRHGHRAEAGPEHQSSSLPEPRRGTAAFRAGVSKDRCCAGGERVGHGRPRPEGQRAARSGERATQAGCQLGQQEPQVKLMSGVPIFVVCVAGEDSLK